MSRGENVLKTNSSTATAVVSIRRVEMLNFMNPHERFHV